MTEYKTPIPCRIYNASGGNVCGTNDVIDDVKGKKQSQINTEVEGRITDLEDTAVRTCSYDASVSVGLADNVRGDTVVNAEFYKRKTGGTQSVGSGIAAIKEVRGKSIVWNQLVDTNTTEVATISGRKYLTKINDVKSIITSTGAAITVNDASVDQVFDLTLMTLPSISIADFKKMFPLAHYDYNVGEVIPFAGQNLVTTGRNQYNPATGKANLLGGQQYKISGTYTKIYPTVSLVDYTYGSPVVIDTYYTNANSHYVGAKAVSAYDNTTTYALGSYCAYDGAIYKSNVAIETAEEFDATHWDVIADVAAMVTESILTLWDIIPDANGLFTLTKDTEMTVVGGNDTDTMIVIYNGESSAYEPYEPYEKHTLPLDPSQWRDKNGNLVYPYGGMHGVGTAYDYAKVDADGYIRKAMRVYERRAYESGDVTDGNIITDGRTYTFYPLAEPIEVELATPVYAKYLVDKDGTEEITPANGTKPYTTMANLSILYAMDARGEIKNLPKNYLSKESAENMLDAMVSAGVIASYTMTYDAANGRYAFTIVAPA